ncbi:hypothetical protein SADUNF_Sadunf10G0068100 [Salix dunnii]|uniref:Uncharacterized protein n=1 Tax=Salix dunnii TaxID=1413687 RepID=A0A835MRI2_9ROSI|nr:hypothetical protein SADUNF_Sadunf10G0068100 [Salix dunnii]
MKNTGLLAILIPGYLGTWRNNEEWCTHKGSQMDGELPDFRAPLKRSDGLSLRRVKEGLCSRDEAYL